MSSYINALVETVSKDMSTYTTHFYFGIGRSLVSLQLLLRLLEKKATPIHTCSDVISVTLQAYAYSYTAALGMGCMLHMHSVMWSLPHAQ